MRGESEKILKKLSKQELEALKELFEEEISRMTDLENIKSFEELVGKQVAIRIIRGIMWRLGILKEKPFEKPKNEYI